MMMKYYGASHQGLRRKNNQDSLCIMENAHHALLAVVCDGIGGGNAGDVASKMAVDHMKEAFLSCKELKNDQDVKRWLEKVIQEANDMVFTQSTRDEKLKGMGTTIVGVLTQEDNTYIFNAGDSRTYGLYKDDFLCLTEDHSYVADLLKRGEVSEEEAAKHPNRNVLINALGIWNSMRIDINKIKNDWCALLVCSDGLHGYVPEHNIQYVLQSNRNVKDKVDALIKLSLDAGGYDNVSVIVIEKEDGGNE